MPYGWQFAGEEVFMPAAKGAGLNCFALLTRANDLVFETTRRRITSQFVIGRKLKYEWLQPADYATTDGLFYRIRQALAAVGTT